MRTRVKFCGMVRPADVDAAVAIGADAIGFVFYPASPRFIEPAEAARLRRRLPSWVMAVGLFVNEDPAVRDATAAEVGLDVLQAHGNETADSLRGLSLPWWKALRIGGTAPLDDDPVVAASLSAQGRVPADPAAIMAACHDFSGADACLLDSASQGFGGSGRAFDWSMLPPGQGSRLVLAGGLTPETVARAVAEVSPFAVDVSSGIQGADPRVKDVSRMERFMAAVQRADLDRLQAVAVGRDRNC
ncbi:MAG: phosphoribosylanthranilate isomerase [Lautropia sp.]|nr:phosphoribosylanthranilate isomerase [Lautropia sp.]